MASTSFLYDGLNPVQELSGGVVSANLLTGLNTDEYLSRADSAGARYFLPDALESTLGLTDSAGVVQTSYTYEPFGVGSAQGAANANTYRYIGRENDGDGIYFHRGRYYNPIFSRFLSEDPSGLSGGDINLYRYALDAPTNGADRNGLYTLEGFPEVDAAQMSRAIGLLAAKLKNTYCVDKDLRKQLLDRLQPFNPDGGVKFKYSKNPLVRENGELDDAWTGKWDFYTNTINVSEPAIDGRDPCPLAGIIMHELVHLNWSNNSEADAKAEAGACFGKVCNQQGNRYMTETERILVEISFVFPLLLLISAGIVEGRRGWRGPGGLKRLLFLLAGLVSASLFLIPRVPLLGGTHASFVFARSMSLLSLLVVAGAAFGVFRSKLTGVLAAASGLLLAFFWWFGYIMV